MSASTPTIQSGLGTGPLIAGLTTVVLAVTIASAIAIGVVAISNAPANPVAPEAPMLYDRGWASESSAIQPLTTLETASLQERIAQDAEWRKTVAQETATRLQMGRAALLDTAPRPGEFRLAPGNLQPAATGDDTGVAPGSVRSNQLRAR